MSHPIRLRPARLIFGLVGLLSMADSQAFNIFDDNTAAPSKPMRSGYTCCNLHYENDWISDANWGGMPFIPAGTPVKVKDFGRYRIFVDMNGKPMRIGLDYGREQQTLEQFSEKMVVLEDPKTKIASFPADVREAIRQGKVMSGMTKEQVIIAVGYPEADQTPSLDSSTWSYWLSSFESYQLKWSQDGRVKEIVTDPATRARMVYEK